MIDAYNDNDPGACAWLRELIARNLIPKGEVLEASILDLRPSDLAGFRRVHFFAGIGGWPYALRLAGIRDDDPRRIWTGSPPCQPFSPAGKRLADSDARHLAPQFIGLVGACRPEMLFGEQVASAAVFGKTAKRARVSVEGVDPLEWAWLDDLSDRLEAARYAIGASDIPAAGIGAPHIRQRTFFGAIDLDRLADAYSRQRGWIADGEGRQRDGEETGWIEGNGQPAACGEPDRPDPLDGFWRGADWLFCRDGKWRPVEPGLEPLAPSLPRSMGALSPEAQRLAKVAGLHAGSLRRAKQFRTESLRGYGNSIIPELAAEFVRAFEEAQWSLT